MIHRSARKVSTCFAQNCERQIWLEKMTYSCTANPTFHPLSRKVCLQFRRRLAGAKSGQACALSCRVTAKCKPAALSTASSVFTVGFPFGPSARYRLSRGMPARSATAAMPCASATWRRATSSAVWPPGSSASSKAAAKYAFAKSGSAFSSSTTAVSCGRLAGCLFVVMSVSFAVASRASLQGRRQCRIAGCACLRQPAVTQDAFPPGRSTHGSQAPNQCAVPKHPRQLVCNHQSCRQPCGLPAPARGPLLVGLPVQ